MFGSWGDLKIHWMPFFYSRKWFQGFIFLKISWRVDVSRKHSITWFKQSLCHYWSYGKIAWTTSNASEIFLCSLIGAFRPRTVCPSVRFNKLYWGFQFPSRTYVDRIRKTLIINLTGVLRIYDGALPSRFSLLIQPLCVRFIIFVSSLTAIIVALCA